MDITYVTATDLVPGDQILVHGVLMQVDVAYQTRLTEDVGPVQVNLCSAVRVVDGGSSADYVLMHMRHDGYWNQQGNRLSQVARVA